MGIIRTDTILFEFREVPPPKDLEVHMWLRKLGLVDGDAAVIDYSFFKKRITLKFEKTEKFERFLQKYDNYEVEYIEEKKIQKIQYTANNLNNKNITIIELPIEANLEELKKKQWKNMEKYLQLSGETTTIEGRGI